MRRVSVVGSSGSGKTTPGKAIAARAADPRWSHLEFVRLTSPSQAEEFVDSLRSR